MWQAQWYHRLNTEHTVAYNGRKDLVIGRIHGQGLARDTHRISTLYSILPLIVTVRGVDFTCSWRLVLLIWCSQVVGEKPPPAPKPCEPMETLNLEEFDSFLEPTDSLNVHEPRLKVLCPMKIRGTFDPF